MGRTVEEGPVSPVRRTRIVCTIGPSSSSLHVLRAMVQAGMDVARLNFSHGDADTHREAAANVREAAESVARPIALLGDLQGPKIRTGAVEGTFHKLVRGRAVRLVGALGVGPHRGFAATSPASGEVKLEPSPTRGQVKLGQSPASGQVKASE